MEFFTDNNYIGMDKNGEITNWVLLNKLLEESKSNLDNGSYITALTTALTIPDICFSLLNKNIVTSDTQHIRIEPHNEHEPLDPNNPERWNASYKYAYFLNKYADINLLSYRHDSLPVDQILIGLFSYYLRCSLLHDGRVELENDLNLSSLILFETDLKRLFDNDNNQMSSNGDSEKSQLERRLEFIKFHRMNINSVKNNTLKLSLKLDFRIPNESPIVIHHDDNDSFFSINAINLSRFILSAGRKYIDSIDDPTTSENTTQQDISSPGSLILDSSSSRLDRDNLN